MSKKSVPRKKPTNGKPVANKPANLAPDAPLQGESPQKG